MHMKVLNVLYCDGRVFLGFQYNTANIDDDLAVQLGFNLQLALLREKFGGVVVITRARSAFVWKEETSLEMHIKVDLFLQERKHGTKLLYGEQHGFS